MQTISLKVQSREANGKKAAKALRREGLIPCVLYNRKENINFSVAPLDVRSLVYTGDFKLAEIEVEGKAYKCILKDLAFHPVTENIIHLDFLELEDGHPVKVDIPVRFKGTSPGVKIGGKLQQTLRTVKMKTTPEHLVDQVLLDISSLELGQSLKVKDIEVDGKVEILNSPSVPVVSVITPRALRSKTSKEEATAE